MLLKLFVYVVAVSSITDENTASYRCWVRERLVGPTLGFASNPESITDDTFILDFPSASVQLFYYHFCQWGHRRRLEILYDSVTCGWAEENTGNGKCCTK